MNRIRLMMNFMFHFSAAAVLPFWILMIVLPNHVKTIKIIKSPYIIIPPIFCYLGFLIPDIVPSIMIFKDPSLISLAKLMGTVNGAGLFWAYAGAFDLFVGRWIFFDAKDLNISTWVTSPILFICILFGPLAFIIYSCVRIIRKVRD